MILAYDAISHWNVQPTQITLAAERENKVYRVTTAFGEYALRQHRAGYRTDAQLESELAWMAAVSDAGLSVPEPVKTRDGAFLMVVDGAQFDLLSWLPGRQLGAHGTPLDLPNPEQTFHTLGETMAQLHIASDAWDQPTDFTRPAWDADGLLGDSPLWGRFWENPTLTETQQTQFTAFRAQASETLASISLDFGLIHADLLRENILVDGENIHLIDFDDGGPGFRLFEIATTLFRIKDEPDYLNLKTALLAGYRTVRPLDTTLLPLFFALRACTYVGWIVTRMEIPNAATRNQDHINNALNAIKDWQTSECTHV